MMYNYLTSFVSLAVLTPILTSSLTGRCDLERLRIPGDIILSTIVRLREPSGRHCGPYLTSEIQLAAAMAWVVEKLNRPHGGDSYIPGKKIGIDLADNCGLDRKAVKMALGTLIASGSPDVATCEDSQCALNTTSNNATVVGLVDTSTSQTVSKVAELFGADSLPVIASGATAADLSDRSVYPSLFRTVSSDQEQMKVILETVKQMNWTYIAVVYTSDKYGKEGLRLFRELVSAEEKVCIMTELSISSQERSSDRARDILTSLATWLDRTRYDQLGVVYIGQLPQAVLLKDIQQLGANGKRYKDFRRLFWVMSEAVGTNKKIIPNRDSQFGGILTVALPSIELTEFKHFFVQELFKSAKGTSNHPLADLLKIYLEMTYSCSLVDGTENHCPVFEKATLERDFQQSDFVPSAVDALYFLATAVKIELCGEDTATPCNAQWSSPDKLRNIVKTVQSVTLDYSKMPGSFAPYEFRLLNRKLRFDANRQLSSVGASPSYEIFNAWDGVHKRVGVFKNDKLTLATESIRFRDPDGNQALKVLARSTCKGSCLECFRVKDIPFTYIPGDRLILGLFSLSYNVQNGFECGEFRSNTVSYPALEAFSYAITAIKNEYPRLNFGGIAFDDCYNPLRAQYILSSFFSGLHNFTDTNTGVVIDPDNVMLVVGPMPSDVSIGVAEMLTRLGIPQISYGSASSDLDDRRKYLYFLRTVPSMVSQAQGIASIIETMGWKYVAAVYLDNHYGRSGFNTFKQQASERGICVADIDVSLSQSITQTEFKNVVTKLRKTFAKVIVYFGIDTLAEKLLDGLRTYADEGEFIFVATEAWGFNKRLLTDGRQHHVKGSLVFHYNTPILEISQHFENFLEKKNPYYGRPSAWLKLFWQDHFKCDLEYWYHGMGRRVCSEKNDDILGPETIKRFSRDQRVLHAINAVVAGAKGIHTVLASLCAAAVCHINPRLISGGVEMLVRNISNVSLPTSTGNVRIFDRNGNGNIGFSVYSIQYLENEYGYREVGTYENGVLDLDKEKIVFYEYAQAKHHTYIKSECSYEIKRCCRNDTTGVDWTSETDITAMEVNTYREEFLATLSVGAVLVTGVITALIVCCVCRRIKNHNENTAVAHPRPRQEVTEHVNHAFNQSSRSQSNGDQGYSFPSDDLYSEVTPRTFCDLTSPARRQITQAELTPTTLRDLTLSPPNRSTQGGNHRCMNSPFSKGIYNQCSCVEPQPVERIDVGPRTVGWLCGGCQGIITKANHVPVSTV